MAAARKGVRQPGADAEQSTNAGKYFTSGLKGRWGETRRKDNDALLGQTREMNTVEGGQVLTKTVPLLGALNLDPAAAAGSGFSWHATAGR